MISYDFNKNIIISTTQMFFGRIITEKNSFLYNQKQVDETVGDVICISNAALAPTSKERATLFARQDGVQYKIADLTKEQPNLPLNFFLEIDQDIQLFVRGNGIVHVVGFFQAEHQVGHLDEVQLHHLHEKQAERNQHQHENDKQIKQTVLKAVNNFQNVNEAPALIQTSKPQNSLESQQHNESLSQQQSLDSQKQLQSNSELSQEGSPLKGLDDIDDDIGEQKKLHKKGQFKIQKTEHINKKKGNSVGIKQMNQLPKEKSENKKAQKEKKKNKKKNAFLQGNKQKDINKSYNPVEGNKNNRGN